MTKRWRAVRTRHGCLQTAVHTWTREADRRTVTLVGTAHVADQRYYRTLHELIANACHKGAVVHYEAVRNSADADLEAASDEERNAITALKSLTSLVARLASAAGLVHQRDGLAWGNDWVNTDVSDLELVRMFGPKELLNLPSEDLDRAVKLFERTALGRRLFRVLLRNLGHLAPLANRLGRDKLDRGVTLDWRNIVAATAALNTPAGTHVVAIWGAAHLPGIGCLLRRNGFTLDTDQWFTAIGRWHPGSLSIVKSR